MLNRKLSKYFKKNIGAPTEDDYKIYGIILEKQATIYSSSQNLTALAEMKIIYMFKSLEIKMKSLIHIAYPQINTNDFFRFDTMISFFKSVGISIKDINGYKEVVDLRKINNNIKHSDKLSEDAKKIKEFASYSELNEYNIDLFIKRIRVKIDRFYKCLIESVIDELFTYDEPRIENLCNNFSEKMDKKTLELFVETLAKKI